jgi:hypothetical protein
MYAAVNSSIGANIASINTSLLLVIAQTRMPPRVIHTILMHANIAGSLIL